ncbi:MAG: DNA polymerase III subunit alpha, partial [Bdellovibrionales bacterium]|nr:DNA polymerase III subunit alpha [Bdellovibrionales bacterium]
MSQFVHLHLHTQYSLLDGLNKVKPVIERAHQYGQPAIAMTDHGNLHGAIEFYNAAKDIGIKPIIGCEMYVTLGSRFERKARAQGGSGTHHITVLAQSFRGYQNLCRLATLAYKEGFYFKPRVDHELLSQFSEDLVILSGCLAGELGRAALEQNLDLAESIVDFYARTFAGRYYLEIQPHPIEEQQRLNQLCYELSAKKGLPLVATTDCHYLDEADHYAQEVLMCISTGTQITDPNRIQHQGVKLYLKQAQDMLNEFGASRYVEEAISNSVEIARSCNLEFDFSRHYMPQFETDSGETLDQSMANAARSGLARRLKMIRNLASDWNPSDEQIYRDRLEEEIAMINSMGFSGYFLICADFIVWAKEQGVPVGPGRGSAAGSLVAYAMRITDVDPIRHKLLFERFLNPKRVSLPDIDVDFCITGRDRVIEYVIEKYGADRVAQIATFGTLK